jgi:acyl-CoA synthetase (AMP-forming)/AMP-acid ligase II
MRALRFLGYGLSECSPAVTVQHPNDGEFVGTVGKLFSGTYDTSFIATLSMLDMSINTLFSEARLVDPNTEEDVKPGEEGELWIRGPQVMM